MSKIPKIAATLLLATQLSAQDCETVIWQENFGHGATLVGDPNPAVNQAYNFGNWGVGPGNYGVVNEFYHHSSWHVVPEDHTPNDTGGYFMIIDGLGGEPVFYMLEIDSLSPNTTYLFSGWALNIDLPQFQSNLTFKFSICTPDGTEIANTTTGLIPATSQPVWTNHGLQFNTGNNTAVILKIIFTSTGYDDFAFDDFQLSAVGVNTERILDSLCVGQTLTAGGQTFDFAHPKDSVFLPGGSVFGCDSLIVVDLKFFDSATDTLNLTLCKGENLQLNNLVFDEANPQGSVFFQNTTSGGCDSTLFVNLKFHAPEKIVKPTLCAGEQFSIGGQTFDAQNPSGLIVIPSGSYLGCDSLIFVELDFLPAPADTLNLTFCPGETYQIGNLTLSETNPQGSLVFENGSAMGCDSTLFVHLKFHAPAATVLQTTLCFGEKLEFGGLTLDAQNPSGLITLPGGAVSGCDSLVWIEVSFHPQASGVWSPSLCFNESISVGGKVFDASNPSGTVVFPGGSAAGCDSTLNVILLFVNELSINIEQTLCAGDSLVFRGKVFNEAHPEDSVRVVSSSECDTVFHVKLNFLAPATGELKPFICFGDSLFINGILFTAANPAGKFFFPGGSENGCDSTLLVNLEIGFPAESQFDTVLFVGQNIAVGGAVFDEKHPSGLVHLENSASSGCDSVVRVRVEFLERKVYIPNVFSPNGDGFNDKFLVFTGACVSEIRELWVFDRWGDWVFADEHFPPNDFQFGWDGTFRGRNCETGVYAFLVVVVFSDGLESVFEGNVTVFR